MEEIWKDIRNYEGLYQVSNLGRVKTLDRYIKDNRCVRFIKGRLIKPSIGKGGYKYVKLHTNGSYKTYAVHRLVAFAFIPNPNNLPQVNHKDENPSNNNVDNLEWCTAEYNVNYGTRTKRHQEKMPKKIVQQCDLNWNVMCEYESLNDAARKNNYCIQNISQCCNNIPHHLTYKGYKWRFKNNGE